MKDLCFCSAHREHERNALQPFTHPRAAEQGPAWYLFKTLLCLSYWIHIPTSWHKLQSSILTTYSQNKQALFAILLVQTPLLLSWNGPTSGRRTPGLPIYIKSNRGEWSFDPTGISINSTRVCQCTIKVPQWFLCSPGSFLIGDYTHCCCEAFAQPTLQHLRSNTK